MIVFHVEQHLHRCGTRRSLFHVEHAGGAGGRIPRAHER